MVCGCLPFLKKFIDGCGENGFVKVKGQAVEEEVGNQPMGQTNNSCKVFRSLNKNSGMFIMLIASI